MPSAKELRSKLSAQLREGLLSHAVLIEGEKGAGKRELALWLAKAMLCRGENKPCEVCSSCHKANAGSHPDIRILEDTKNVKSFGIDPIRDMKDELYIVPNESEYKVYLLFDAEKMTSEAQNAFLKSLEEPPAFARFILTCDNRKSLLETIISRVTCYTLDVPSKEECAETLAGKFPDISAEEAKLLSLAYGGNIGAATAALESGKKDFALLAIKSPELFKKGLGYTVAKELGALCKKREDISEYLEPLNNVIGRFALDRAAGKPAPARITLAQAVKISDIIERGKEAALKQNCNPDLIISWLCMELSVVFGGNT